MEAPQRQGQVPRALLQGQESQRAAKAAHKGRGRRENGRRHCAHRLTTTTRGRAPRCLDSLRSRPRVGPRATCSMCVCPPSRTPPRSARGPTGRGGCLLVGPPTAALGGIRSPAPCDMRGCSGTPLHKPMMCVYDRAPSQPRTLRRRDRLTRAASRSSSDARAPWGRDRAQTWACVATGSPPY